MALRNPDAILTYDILDHFGRVGTFGMSTSEYSIVNFTMFLTAVGDFRDSIALISGGTVIREEYAPFVERLNPIPPTSPNFQRERRWVVTLIDVVNYKISTMSIPCARVDGTNDATYGTDLVDPNGFANLGHDDFNDFVAFMESIALSVDGNMMNVQNMYLDTVNT